MYNQTRFDIDHPYLSGQIPSNDLLGFPVTGLDSNGYPIIGQMNGGDFVYAQLAFQGGVLPPNCVYYTQLQNMDNYSIQQIINSKMSALNGYAYPPQQGNYAQAGQNIQQQGQIVQNTYAQRQIPPNQQAYRQTQINQRAHGQIRNDGYSQQPNVVNGYANIQNGANNIPYSTQVGLPMNRRQVIKPSKQNASVLGKLTKRPSQASSQDIKAAQQLFNYEEYRANNGFDLMDMFTTSSGINILCVSLLIPVMSLIALVSPIISVTAASFVYVVIGSLLVNQAVKDYDIQEYVKDVRAVALKTVAITYIAMFVITLCAGLSQSFIFVLIVTVIGFLLSFFCPSQIVSGVLAMENKAYQLLNCVADEVRNEVQNEMKGYRRLEFEVDDLLENEGTGQFAAELEDGSLILTNEFGIAQLDSRGNYVYVTEDAPTSKSTEPKQFEKAQAVSGGVYVVKKKVSKGPSAGGLFDEDDGEVEIEVTKTAEQYILDELDSPRLYSSDAVVFFVSALPYYFRSMAKADFFSKVKMEVEDLLDEQVQDFDTFKLCTSLLKKRGKSLVSLPLFSFKDKQTEEYVRRLRRDINEVQDSGDVTLTSLKARVTFYNVEGKDALIDDKQIEDCYDFVRSALHLFDRIMESKLKISLYGGLHVSDDSLISALDKINKYYEHIDENCPLDVARQKLFII